MTAQRLITALLEAFLALFAIFLAHRLLSVAALSPTELTPLLYAQALLVGALSDAWVACLGALTIVLASLALEPRAPTAARRVRAGLLLGFGFAFAGHQNYVDFYRTQVTPFHLRYLLDPDFLAANSPSLLTARSLAIFGVAVAAVLILHFLTPLHRLPARRLKLTAALLMPLCLVAHNRNIHLRTQWFVHDNLQVNALERLYIRARHQSLPVPLSGDEMRRLALALESPVPQDPARPAAAELLTLLTKPPVSGPLSPLGEMLKETFASAVARGERPVILIVLLESLRPAETGYFAPGAAPSLTPRLDDVAARGVVFTRAFSTGSVTRGGQEAVFCGYLGSRDTSLLRGQTTSSIACLPDLLRAAGLSHDVFWYHGGEGRFDNQLAFWQGRGISDTLSLKDFPSEAPRSDWGVADRAFFGEVARRLTTAQARSTADFLLGMALSVTNHIPWAMPPDGGDLSLPAGLRHPSYATTAYTDAALGTLIDRLRETGLWDKALLVVASDHGNHIPPYHDIYAGLVTGAHHLQSHINLLLTGGLTEAALQRHGVTNVAIDTPTSQADVASLVAFLTGAHGARFMGENPFSQTRSLPVISILEQDLFLPGHAAAYRAQDAAKRQLDDLPPEHWVAALYFRAFLQFVNLQQAATREPPR